MTNDLFSWNFVFLLRSLRGMWSMIKVFNCTYRSNRFWTPLIGSRLCWGSKPKDLFCCRKQWTVPTEKCLRLSKYKDCPGGSFFGQYRLSSFKITVENKFTAFLFIGLARTLTKTANEWTKVWPWHPCMLICCLLLVVSHILHGSCVKKLRKLMNYEEYEPISQHRSIGNLIPKKFWSKRRLNLT